MRTCGKCGVQGKTPETFRPGQGNTCRDCVKRYDTARRIEIQNEGGERHERRKEVMRIAQAKRLYGLTADEARALYTTELCEICGRAAQEAGNDKRLNIDHCHKLGLVRGVLCNRCNRGLGFFLDDPALLEAAAAYIRRASQPKLEGSGKR